MLLRMWRGWWAGWLVVRLQEMLSSMVKDITGGYVVRYVPEPGAAEITLDFTPPFRRVSMMAGLDEAMGVTLPRDLETEAARATLDRLCAERGACVHA